LDYIPRNQDISILEVGFGTGLLHLELAKLPHKQLAGLDLAPGMVKLSQKRLGAKESDLRVGDVTKGLPWENESFDVVLSTFVLSAISDTTAAISEMVRVLKPGGKLIIVDAGAAQDEPRRVSRFLAVLWELLGDYMRDDAELLLSHADMVSATREDYGPWKCVHVTVGEKKGSTS
jgi:ubiquinone/menaquinone biosynthesis C-methylase UbiE